MKIKCICVYLGSSCGNDPIYRQGAEDLGAYIARHGYELVYGGSNIGLMGILAKAALEGGARVFGVIPRSMHAKVGHYPLTKTYIVENMHQRKMKMHDLADAFIAMPGGLGTLEEIFEMLTWQQLGYHIKPCCFFNLAGYYDGLFTFLDHTMEQGFIQPVHRRTLLTAGSPEELFRQLSSFTPPQQEKWL